MWSRFELWRKIFYHFSIKSSNFALIFNFKRSQSNKKRIKLDLSFSLSVSRTVRLYCVSRHQRAVLHGLAQVIPVSMKATSSSSPLTICQKPWHTTLLFDIKRTRPATGKLALYRLYGQNHTIQMGLVPIRIHKPKIAFHSLYPIVIRAWLLWMTFAWKKTKNIKRNYYLNVSVNRKKIQLRKS